MATSEKIKENPVGSFVRWQTITIQQLSYVVNLLLTLSVSALGFGVLLLFKKEFLPENWCKTLFTYALLGHLISVAFGMLCNIIRLSDFRITKDIARAREKGIDGFEDKRAKTEKLGNWTWVMFRWQILMFGFGTLMFLCSVVIINRAKLF